MADDRRADLSPSVRRLPQLWFHTGNAEKWLQARLLSDKYGLIIRQSTSEAGKIEDYALGPDVMLRRSLDHAVSRTNRRSLIFVEDTTVRINALSGDSDWPGLATKEWFASTTFSELDAALLATGNDRSVIVTSKIALHVPGLIDPVFFSGSTEGRVADRLTGRKTHPLYRWLTTDSFNGWFIPEGATEPLGAMGKAEAAGYDFRERSLRQLFGRIQEYTAVASLPSGNFRNIKTVTKLNYDDSLPMSDTVNAVRVLVVGRTCAGKSTYAERATDRHGWLHIEASTQLRRIIPPADAALPDPVRESGKYAEALLDKMGRDAVARHIVQEYGDYLDNNSFVISGLRTIEEVDYLVDVLNDLKIVLVEAPANQRWERSLLRPRPGRPAPSRSAFRELDRRQDIFGLLPVAAHLADYKLGNSKTLDDYLVTLDKHFMTLQLDRMGDATHQRHTRLSRALQLLKENGEMTLPEVEKLGMLGQHNASRFFGQAPVTVDRVVPRKGPHRWRLSKAGEAYLRVLATRTTKIAGLG